MRTKKNNVSTPILKSFFVTCILADVVHAHFALCSGSKDSTHAKCDMAVSFPQDQCEIVQTEILSRMAGKDGWIDPHNRGTYSLIESKQSELGDRVIKGERQTGDKKYVDKFMFTLVPTQGGSGCTMSACSESQVFSILDFSTNYCNLRMLYCNTSDGCEVLKSNLVYKEKYTNCRQRQAANCISQNLNQD